MLYIYIYVLADTLLFVRCLRQLGSVVLVGVLVRDVDEQNLAIGAVPPVWVSVRASACNLSTQNADRSLSCDGRGQMSSSLRCATRALS